MYESLYYFNYSITNTISIIFNNYCLVLKFSFERKKNSFLISRVLNIVMATFLNNLSKYDILFFSRNYRQQETEDAVIRTIKQATRFCFRQTQYTVAKDFVPYRDIENLFTPMFCSEIATA